MKRFLFSIVLIGLAAAMVNAETVSSDFGIRFSGFVKTDLMFDSRQTVTAREGHFLLYPAAESPDVDGDDINATPNLNILAIQTRLKGSISGPDAFGAKTGGIIEGAFFGHSNSDVNGFRLRHAFLTLKWDTSTLLMGQYWHPMFVTDVYPGTVSFNTGSPFQPFSRNPQIRFTKTMGAMNWIVAAMSQRDFASSGPNGTSSTYLRNAVIPNLHFQLQKKSEGSVLGIGADLKMLTPQLTVGGFKTTEKVTGLSAIAYAKFNMASSTFKIQGVYGQNMTDHLMLGGYAVETIDEAAGEITYLPTTVMSVWTELSGGKEFAYGIFGGYTKNLGTSDTVAGSFYGRGSDIDAIYRIAPRLMWTSGKTRFAAELEYTAAAYGNPDEELKIEDSESVANLRLLLAAYYFF